jgi:hypothetical protein
MLLLLLIAKGLTYPVVRGSSTIPLLINSLTLFPWHVLHNPSRE